MRVSKAVMATNNAKIVDSAASLFRKNGIATTSVAQVMAAADLTHGGFYRHFASKDALVDAALDKAFADLATPLAEDIKTLGSKAALGRFVTNYLSESHALNPAKGCPISALAGEANRKTELQKAAFRRGKQRFIELLAQGFDGPKKKQQAKARTLLALLVGSLVLARGAESKVEMKKTLKAGAEGAALMV